MSATLRLTRDGIGIELRRGVFDVCVDGTSVGQIKWQEPLRFLASLVKPDLAITLRRD